jgi:hypothetical protein
MVAAYQPTKQTQMPKVLVTETETQTRDQLFNATVDLNNYERYQLRVTCDSVGGVWVWIDHYKNHKWTKLIELKDGEQRQV